jgi:hypothetical protein
MTRHRSFFLVLVASLFSAMTEDEIAAMAESIGKNAAKDIALFMKTD